LDGRSDENLVMASRNGDKSAYAQLIRRHYKHVFIVCLGVTGHVDDAEDITQEAMLTGFTKLKTLRNSSQFRPWIAKIAKNMSLNLARRNRRSQQIIRDKAISQVDAERQNKRLQHAIERLPLEIRQPLVMYYFDDRSVQSVADDLDISTSAVYSRLRSAIRELHRLLAGQGDENG
jgi:RNA polymerase sigma-70 factor (ECF subfamily)